ncbi:MAG: hypothetical protein E7466_00065 [Ruminococcaceae bacterium]|nr:hypothetical protein [Oscillospiraceae bacterium]
MNFFAIIEEKWNLICVKTKPFRTTTGKVLRKIASFLQITWSYLYRLRTVFMAVPVSIAAIVLALQNMARLPDSVGIWLLSNGEFYMLVPKELAVIAPVAVTAFCILLVLLSKKALYPWLISIFTLILPFWIYYTNLFPV